MAKSRAAPIIMNSERSPLLLDFCGCCIYAGAGAGIGSGLGPARLPED